MGRAVRAAESHTPGGHGVSLTGHKAFLPSYKKKKKKKYYYPGPALASSETDQGALEQATGRVLRLRIEVPCTEGYC